MALPRYPRQSGARLRGFGAFGQQAGPCWTDNNGAVNCPAGYHVDANTGRVAKDNDINWQPIVEAGTGIVLAIVNAASGQKYTYPQGQQPVYQQGAVYSPPWYEQVPTWAWAGAGGLLIALAWAAKR